MTDDTPEKILHDMAEVLQSGTSADLPAIDARIDALDVDSVAGEIRQLLHAIDALEIIHTASVSEVYERGDWWRCCVAINDRYVRVPRFRRQEDALAFREAASDALDRAT
jgi:hypothetical protein